MKRAVLSAVAMAGLGCGVPKRPLPALTRSIRPVSRSFMEEVIARRKVSGVTLRIYNTGSIRTRGAAVSSMKSWSSRVRLDDPFFLIKHSEEGAVLFDLGLTTGIAKTLNSGALTGLVVNFESRPGLDAVSQLRTDGVAPDDVQWIVLSHLHQDHLGDLSAFSKATVVVSRREWEDQKRRANAKPGPKEFDPTAWESRLKLRLLDLEGEAPYGAFDHGLDLFADGTVIIAALPGHTAGSIGAWVNLDGGPVMLAGDAAWVIDNYMDLALPHAHGMRDAAAYRRSLEMLRAMQEAMPRLVIFPGHDLTPRKLSDRGDLPLVTPTPIR